MVLETWYCNLQTNCAFKREHRTYVQFLHAHLVIATENVSIDMMPLDIRLLYLETTRFCTAISKQSSRPD